MPVHDAELHAGPDGRIFGPYSGHGGPVGPEADRHVVAGADEHVAGVRAPGQPADGVVVARHDGRRAGRGGADVEGADHAVHAARGHHGVIVLVPVVGQDLGGHGRGREARRQRRRRRGVYGDLVDQVVLCVDGRPEIEDAQVRVGRDGGYDIGVRGTV